LGLAAGTCLAFEDTLAGATAAEAAGAAVLVISATHHRPLQTSHPSMASYRDVRPEAAAGGLRLARR
jgi:mannitol-1-/sugar-/sorbitol-6-phosphatase